MPDKDKQEPDAIEESLRAAGVPDEDLAPAQPTPAAGPQKPNPMQLNRLEIADVGEVLGLAQQNTLQIGSLEVAVHQIEAQQEKLDKQKANLEKQKANVVEQQKELLTTADNNKLAIDRILEKARKRLNLPDDRVYSIDQKTWTFIDQGPANRQQ